MTYRIDTPGEVDYYRNGGILHKVLRDLAPGQILQPRWLVTAGISSAKVSRRWEIKCVEPH